jgi:hypothetical protein
VLKTILPLLNRKFVEDHPRNIPANFGSNWPPWFRRRSLKCEKFTDDRCQVMAIVLQTRHIISIIKTDMTYTLVTLRGKVYILKAFPDSDIYYLGEIKC